VLHEARKIYEFEVRGLRVEDDRVSFYINAVDGFMLPAVMQWVKHPFVVFAVKGVANPRVVILL
jgi:hypothetical protein